MIWFMCAHFICGGCEGAWLRALALGGPPVLHIGARWEVR